MELGRGFCLGPILGGESANGVVGGSREPGEDIEEVGVGVNTVTAAGFHDGVEDCRFLPCLSRPDKEPVLFSYSRGSDGILDEIVVDLHPALIQVNEQGVPDGKGIADCLACIALGQELGFHNFNGFMQTCQDGAGDRVAQSRPQGRSGSSLS